MSTIWTDHYARRTAGMTASEIRELLKLLARPEVISFAGGIPDPALFPYEEAEAAYQRIFADPARQREAFQYSTTEGYLPLREWICAFMGQQGVAATPANVLIINGSQQGLDFVGKLLLDAGEAVAVAQPSYLGALQAFNTYEPRYLPLPMDEAGIITAGLADRLAASPKFLYTMPSFQNPTGRTMPPARREALLGQARQLGLPVIEDAAYEELYYNGQAVPSLVSLEARQNGLEAGHVLYLGTFSKTVMPGLRVGWLLGPRPVIERLGLIKQASDLHTSTINQMIVYELVKGGRFEERVVGLREVYGRRRDAMLGALDRSFPAGVRWSEPEGGMFIWVELLPEVNTRDLLNRSIQETGVAFVPGSAFFTNGTGQNTLRLNFSLVQPETINEGIARLGKLF